ncbi:MAG: ATPase, T2SS/T4P/T4SS family [Candidatus Omnitrophica bacterium]|nr:ATPase, T2SS/T4P/T4SS family [Candidatus Omnitrophota bacterium]
MTVKEKIINHIQKNKPLEPGLLKSVLETKDYDGFRHALLANNLITEEELLFIFSKEFKIPFLDLKKYKISAKNQELLPKEIAIKYKVMPIYRIGNVLTLATSNPLNIVTYDDIKIIIGAEKIDLVLSREDDIVKALDLLYKATTDDFDRFLEEENDSQVPMLAAADANVSLESLITESKHPPIVRAIDLIVYNALKKRASDIHVEPQQERLLVKYRVDGALQEEFSFPKKNQQAVIARLKIISSLNITESRLPQDGRFKVKFEGREIDFRVSRLPTHFGVKFVMRVLDK